jgi:NAD(P)-dependent dehydrogenase (short-subunit alcohol dehydrogenase family)
MNLAGKTALVTGATGLLGAALCQTLAEAGCAIIIHSRNQSAEGEKLCKSLPENGVSVFNVHGELTKSDEVARMFERIAARCGGLDILVNNAGCGERIDFLASRPDDWLSAFANNVLTAVLCTQSALPLMTLRPAGRILNVASVRALESCGHPEMMPYSAAKAALVNFSSTLAKTLPPHIKVNTIAPGHIRKDSAESHDSGVSQKSGPDVSPGDVAKLARAILENDSMTGTTVTLDGGFHLR